MKLCYHSQRVFCDKEAYICEDCIEKILGPEPVAFCTNGDKIRAMKSNLDLANHLADILMSKFEWDIDTNFILEFLNSEAK